MPMIEGRVDSVDYSEDSDVVKIWINDNKGNSVDLWISFDDVRCIMNEILDVKELNRRNRISE